MTLTFNADVEQLIQKQLESGKFDSPEAVVKAALSQFDAEAGTPALDAGDWEAIAEADAEGDRGEGVDVATFRSEIRKRYRA